MGIDHPGTIITFYSYKGGTGRSMALANIACLIARQDRRKVLIIDWDLEAPGLHRFFEEKVNNPENQDSLGLIDLFIRLADLFSSDKKLLQDISKENSWKVLDKRLPLSDFVIPEVQSGIDLIKAGKLDGEYSNKVASFDWNRFFQQNGLSIKAFAELISHKYDYCLIDSRTGITDTSGICTTLLPEKLVLVFTPNYQSLYGVLDVAEQVMKYRLASDDLRPLTIYPLPSRVDDAEEELRREWRNEYQSRFEELLSKCYELNNCDLSDYFDEVKLPYKSYYGYGEKIAVLLERDESLSMHRAYKNFYNSLVNLDQIWAVPDDPMSIVQKGQLFENQGRYSEALEVYQQGLAEFENSGDKSQQSIILHSLGLVYQNLANYGQAIDSFNQALEIASQSANKLSQAVVLNDLGVTYQQLRRFDEAADFLRRSYDIFAELNDDNGKSLALNSLGDVLQRQGKLDDAVDAFQRSLELQSKLGDESSQASILYSLGGALQRQGKLDEAIDAFRRSLELRSKLGDNRGQALTWNSLGGALQQQGKFDEAVDAFQRSYKISARLEDSRNLAIALNSLGRVLLQQNKFESAADYMMKAIELEPQSAESYELLGSIYSQGGKYDEAISAYQKSLDLLDKTKDKNKIENILKEIVKIKK
jgi:tetratricopeptide (TPR) repeat protein